MKTVAAQCAALIRKELKAAFPAIKFSVTSDNFAGGNAVRVSYADGVMRDTVESLLSKYQHGSFNGMDDIYEYDNRRDDIPQTKYLTVSRVMSAEAKQLVAKTVAAKYGIELQALLTDTWISEMREFGNTLLYREFYATAF